ncbi:hypothetical protein JB92DRAFT_3236101 [Gautieria morchelliformis]|nr:hypothetical protein JB92DRAFT_3236101 [Gautieria morchelliformis]
MPQILWYHKGYAFSPSFRAVTQLPEAIILRAGQSSTTSPSNATSRVSEHIKDYIIVAAAAAAPVPDSLRKTRWEIVDPLVHPSKLPNDVRPLPPDHPLRRISAKKNCVKPAYSGAYNVPFIAKASKRGNTGKACQQNISATRATLYTSITVWLPIPIFLLILDFSFHIPQPPPPQQPLPTAQLPLPAALVPHPPHLLHQAVNSAAAGSSGLSVDSATPVSLGLSSHTSSSLSPPTLSNLVTSAWERERDLALQFHNLVWYSEVNQSPLIVTIHLTTPYMAIDAIISPTFNLMEFIGLTPKSLFWAYVQANSTNVLKRKSEDIMTPTSKHSKKCDTPHDSHDQSLRTNISTTAGSTSPSYVATPSGSPSLPHSLSPSLPHTIFDSIKFPLQPKSKSSALKKKKAGSTSTYAATEPTHSNFSQLKWPHEFFVVDIVDGLKEYDKRVRGDQSQKEAFLAVFGVPCVRETLRQKCFILEKALEENEDLVLNFVAMGRMHAARWAFFESITAGTKICGKEHLEFLKESTNSDNESVGGYNDESDGSVVVLGVNNGPKDHDTEESSLEIIPTNTFHYTDHKFLIWYSVTAYVPLIHNQKLLDVFLWYEEGNAPSDHRFNEHCDLIGLERGWPTKLDVSWIRSEVMTMQNHCASLMVHAPTNDQFQDMKEL